ncbi:hypothetical protein AMTR_s00014p00039980 [Amborella trichopoda]|uniref:Uncharacterized protein n=1 Tax=Amborella trichopoda TaxID=13333 RepID=W1PGF0_AMBTC|nr:hypothetical protein AMTR_s00014p00039980 [Amborella trichopoda]
MAIALNLVQHYQNGKVGHRVKSSNSNLHGSCFFLRGESLVSNFTKESDLWRSQGSHSPKVTGELMHFHQIWGWGHARGNLHLHLSISNSIQKKLERQPAAGGNQLSIVICRGGNPTVFLKP